MLVFLMLSYTKKANNKAILYKGCLTPTFLNLTPTEVNSTGVKNPIPNCM